MKTVKVLEFPTEGKIVVTYEDASVVTFVPESPAKPPAPHFDLPTGTEIIIN